MQADKARKHTGATGISVAVVGVALILGYWIYRTGPETRTEDEVRPPKMVKAIAVHPAPGPIHVLAYGSVIPARRVTVEPQVSGQVIRQHEALRPGGFISTGEELYAIDPTLAELDLAGAKAEVARAEASLAEARRRLDEGRRLAEESVIPATELASLETTCRMQEATLERLKASQLRAVEELARHVIKAPFNAVVVDEGVELGQRVTPGDVTVTLVGTDDFWVRASVPADKLPWVRLPKKDQPGAPAVVILDTGEGTTIRYPGRVIQLLGDLTEVGRMARVLIQVEDPLSLQPEVRRPPLLLGSYVQIEIDAGEIPDVLTISRAALREGNRIWVVDANQQLQIREVKVRWAEGDSVLIDPALAPDEHLIVSGLRTALPGMEVKPQLDEAGDLSANERPDPITP
jgi:RND family efflux transporter MFP subunit